MPRWKTTKITNDIDLSANTSLPSGTSVGHGFGAPGGTGVEHWVVVKLDAGTEDIVPHYYVPDFVPSGDPVVGTWIPVKKEGTIPFTASTEKGRMFRIPCPPFATRVYLQETATTAATRTAAIYEAREVGK